MADFEFLTPEEAWEMKENYYEKYYRANIAAYSGDRSEECNLADRIVYIKTVLRHEIIHAFLFESGLDGNSVWSVDEQEHPEQVVEWMAIQIPKIAKVFEQLGLM